MYPPPQYGNFQQPPQQSYIHAQQAMNTMPMVQQVPVITQPMSHQTIVQQTTNINGCNNPAPQRQTPRLWSSTLVDCCQDVPSCMLGFCCPCILTCWTASRAGESCCVGCFPDMAVALRTKIRTKHDIQGSVCNDCFCLHCCCTQQLVMCQMYRELNYQGYV